jgi:c(7)-type cytochrome triheme protein
MKKTIVFVLVVALTFVLAASAFAVGPGKTVEFDGKGAGKVTFSGDIHKVNKCNECHPALFKMKKGSGVGTMKEMNEGKSCGTCHNGTKAFDVKDNANCGKCHKK